MTIDCEDDAELAILGTYYKIAHKLFDLAGFLGTDEMCGTTTLKAVNWWKIHAPEYYEEILYFHSISRQNYFNVTPLLQGNFHS